MEPGAYEIFVNYFRDGRDAAGAQASVYFMDPVNGVVEYVLVGSRRMDLTNPASIFWMDDTEQIEEVENGVYSDWLVIGGGNAPVVRYSEISTEPNFAGGIFVHLSSEGQSEMNIQLSAFHLESPP